MSFSNPIENDALKQLWYVCASPPNPDEKDAYGDIVIMYWISSSNLVKVDEFE